jgi:hypothetical protein
VITGGPVTEAMSLEMLDLVRDVRLIGCTMSCGRPTRT